ncbi:MAG: DUF6435 family protein [Marinobacter sp.]|nr:DUF6435 family protein [Marinobacter sp.]MDX1757830.1 DUF6435 family protein [Marinobacter sp.]
MQKAHEDKLAKTLHTQRDGELRPHGTLMEEAEQIYAGIDTLEKRG